MSKVSNCIKFLKVLGNGRKMNIAEISKVLEVSPRMIRQYKQDLELAGYNIETISGRYGGYVINSQKTKNFDKFLDIYDLQLLESIEQKIHFKYLQMIL
ncbi:MAG: HTH domain-containing protein [Clostridia bacterium]|nr:HTH domain-containing protein [Clostridia bacterium]